jgi:copper homeostasis protein CutC
VLIRPRPGGFNYTDDEFDIIQRDVLIAKQLGADGMDGWMDG